MYFCTRSSANYQPPPVTGVTNLLWQGGFPTVDEWQHVVVRFKFGLAGEADFWLDGVKLVTYTGPIGYYTDAGALGYMQFGIYRQWQPEAMIIETANMEWGTADLSGRVLAPLAIAT
jgi:hypothetical protein